MVDLAGKRILHYKIIELVGQVGMGFIYKVNNRLHSNGERADGDLD
jgi:hypothetical protein